MKWIICWSALLAFSGCTQHLDDNTFSRDVNLWEAAVTMKYRDYTSSAANTIVTEWGTVVFETQWNSIWTYWRRSTEGFIHFLN